MAPTPNTTPLPTLTAAAAAVLHAGPPADGAGAVPRGRRGRGLAGRCRLVPGAVLHGLGRGGGGAPSLLRAAASGVVAATAAAAAAAAVATAAAAAVAAAAAAAAAAATAAAV